jgi:hypothetical protein
MISILEIVLVVLYMIGIGCVVGIALIIVLMYRNERVYNYRKRVIENIGEIYQDEIAAGRLTTNWRWKEFEKVTYRDMVKRFWKPLDSFYENTKLEKEIWKL